MISNIRNATFVKGNVIWLALNQVGGSISQQEKELIMSVIGTVILYPPADDGSDVDDVPDALPPGFGQTQDAASGCRVATRERGVLALVMLVAARRRRRYGM